MSDAPTLESFFTIEATIGYLKEEIYAHIQHAQEGEMDRETFSNELGEFQENAIGKFLQTNTDEEIKRLVEDYGIFYAYKLFERNSSTTLPSKNQEEFYSALLEAIFWNSKEGEEINNYSAYQAYCVENPL